MAAAGDDAISGAEALELAYALAGSAKTSADPTATLLGFDPVTAGEFALYDEYAPMHEDRRERRGVVLLNFAHTWRVRFDVVARPTTPSTPTGTTRSSGISATTGWWVAPGATTSVAVAGATTC
jgi:hypothetical protein